MIKLTIRFHKGLASSAYEWLTKKRFNEECGCQRWIYKVGNLCWSDAL